MSMHRLFCAIATYAVLLFARADEIKEMMIYEGRSDISPIEGLITRVNVLDPTIVNASPHREGTAVLIVGIKPGKAQVRVEREKLPDVVFNVSVMVETSQRVGELKELLKSIDGVQIRTLGNKIVLDGTLSVYEDFQRIEQIAKTFEDGVLNLTRFDASKYKELLARAIERDLGLETVKVTVTGDRGETARLEGFVFDPRQVERALAVARTRVQEVDNLLTVEEIMIETDVLFLQIDRTNGKNIGNNILKDLEFNLGFAGSGEEGGKNTFKYNIAGNLKLKIQALVEDGIAEVVAKPHLSTKSGGRGEFLSGGELGFAIGGNVGGSLEKVQYGIRLGVEPTLRGKDQIDAVLDVEVSVPTSAGGGGYSLDKFTTTSVVKCNVGQSIIVSGITQTLRTRFNESTPMLGKIPLLRQFFSNRTESNKERELIVVLTPQPVFPSKARGQAWSNAKQDLITP